MSKKFYAWPVVLIFMFSCNFMISQSSRAWQTLFDGNSLKGWAILGKPANVTIADSSIVLHMTPYTSRHAFVRTNRRFKDFIFEVEFRRDLTIDSGVLFRAEDAPDTAFQDLFGYMVKIDPSQTRLWTGGVFIDYGNGLQWLYPLDQNEKARHAEQAGREWNKLRIEAIGQDIKVYLNGIPTVHLVDDKYQAGYIAFKIHYLMAEKEKADLEIAYRNPRIMTKHLKKNVHTGEVPVKDTRGISDIKYFR